MPKPISFLSLLITIIISSVIITSSSCSDAQTHLLPLIVFIVVIIFIVAVIIIIEKIIVIKIISSSSWRKILVCFGVTCIEMSTLQWVSHKGWTNRRGGQILRCTDVTLFSCTFPVQCVVVHSTSRVCSIVHFKYSGHCSVYIAAIASSLLQYLCAVLVFAYLCGVHRWLWDPWGVDTKGHKLVRVQH